MAVVSETAVSAETVAAVTAETVAVSSVSAVRDLVSVADSGGAVVSTMTVAWRQEKNTLFLRNF